MQKDFIEDEGPIQVKGGKEIVPNVIKAVEVARQRGILIVWVIILQSLPLFVLGYTTVLILDVFVRTTTLVQKKTDMNNTNKEYRK